MSWIDCQGLPPKAATLFDEICAQLRRELNAKMKITLAHNDPDPAEDFRAQILQLLQYWREASGQGPLVIILDEVDKLFPDRRIRGSDQILSEWVSFSRVVRALAQETRAVVMLVTVYRPDINRQNLLSPEIGENPMYMSFQEYFLGSLSKSETQRMVSEIGAWKEIHWSPEALAEVYELCGGLWYAKKAKIRPTSRDSLREKAEGVEKYGVVEACSAINENPFKECNVAEGVSER